MPGSWNFHALLDLIQHGLCRGDGKINSFGAQPGFLLLSRLFRRTTVRVGLLAVIPPGFTSINFHTGLPDRRVARVPRAPTPIES